MPARDAYEILGLPRDSLASAIRSRYRQLARREARETSVAQMFQDARFLEITRAYLLLTSHQRREYDRELRAARGSPVPLSDLLAAQSEGERALLQAEIAFWRALYREAGQCVKTVLDANPKESRAWMMMGNIMMAERKYEEAIALYNYAIQFDPGNQKYWELLNEATARKEGREAPRAAARDEETLARPARVWLVFGGALLFIELSMLWLWMHPGDPWVFGLPKNLLAFGVVNGFLLAAALASTDLLNSFDDELVSYSVPFAGVEMVPLGLYLIPVGVILFWLAIVFYVIICLLDDHLSGSVVVSFLCVAFLTAVMAPLNPETYTQFLVLGANAIFGGFMVGWMFGSLRIFPWRLTAIEKVEESL